MLLTLLISFWGAHWSNMKRIKDATKEYEDLKTKVNIMYGWFERKIINGHTETD